MAEQAVATDRRPEKGCIWVIFRLHDQLFGISSEHIREMVGMPHTVPVPQVPNYVRGMINLRGQAMPVLDARLLLGMASVRQDTEQLITMLRQREEDHKKWLKELEDSILESRDFRLTTDPHMCAFGRWYDAFDTSNLVLKSHLRKFDAPHKEIHGLGVKARVLFDQGKREDALHLINAVGHSTLMYMLGLFAELYAQLQDTHREIGLITRVSGRHLALAVDSVTAVESLPEDSLQPLSQVFGGEVGKFVSHVGKRRGDGALVMLLDPADIDLNIHGLTAEAPAP